MKTRTVLIAGLALIALTNAVALGGVWYNRSGEPESSLLLSERELRRSHEWSRHENSGLALRLEWRRPRDPASDDRYQRLMLDEARLLALGFIAPENGDPRHDSQERQALVVLELDGPARKAELERVREGLQNARIELRANPNDKRRQDAERAARDYLDHEEQRDSRLFAVDLGLDREALRSRYPDRSRYAIVPGSVHAWVRDGHLTGQISELRITAINVPHAWRHTLDKALERDRPAPFQVRVSFGQHLEPWMGEAPALERAEGKGKG
ncbi:DUF4824 family protein [Pseudomonas sp. GCM10022186]|uniref:DUF4824 family protein n=1 Tax=Pseudomonas sp. GCM10022186 TaxID=3252650 RepID=UPI003617E9C6